MERGTEVRELVGPAPLTRLSLPFDSPCRSLAESLAVTLPTLPPLASTSIVTGTGTSGTSNSQGENGSIGGPASPWNDEEEKRFYTDLPDLRGEVPGALLKSEDGPTGETSLMEDTGDPPLEKDDADDLEGINNSNEVA